MARPWLIDTTMRDGAQTPGVSFSARQRMELAELLAASGVPEIEIGIPAMGADECAAIRAVASLKLPCRLSVWCRAKLDDLEAAAACGVGAIHISVPASSIHLTTLEHDMDWARTQLWQSAEWASSRFDYVSIGAQDASRAEMRDLRAFAALACAAKADRLRLADTVGLWEPFRVAEIFESLHRHDPDLELAIHAHNDLGLAAANTLAALTHGATAGDVTVNGMGERAGNAALEAVAVALKLLHGCDCGMSLENISRLSQMTASFSRQKVPSDKPVVGSAVFRHESGIHAQAQLKDSRCYEPFPPQLVGTMASEISFGSHSGSANLCHMLAGNGYPIDREQAKKLLPLARRLAMNNRGSLLKRDLEILGKLSSKQRNSSLKADAIR